MLTTVSGKPLRGVHYNGVSDGFPHLNAGHYSAKLVSSGPISSLVISHLSQSGGSGSIMLLTPAGKPFTGGSITLNGRVVIKVHAEQSSLLPGPSDFDVP